MRRDVYWINGPWPGKLGILPRPRGADWLDYEVGAWKDAGVGVVVSLLTQAEDWELGLADERALVQQNGLTFIAFPIPDYSVPSSMKTTRQLVSKLQDCLARGENVGIHCRQGIGRSSLVAACVLVTAGESAGTAFQHIKTARGVPVPDTPEQRDWVATYARSQVTGFA